MNYTELRKLIEEAFELGWGTETPIAWENAPAIVDEEYWVRCSILTTDSRNSTIGTKRTVKTGIIVIQIFAPLDKGVGRAYELADLANTILENNRWQDLFTYAGRVEHIGQSPTTSFNPGGSGQFRQLTPGFFQINVKIPFEANS
jgi:hypothetical protein